MSESPAPGGWDLSRVNLKVLAPHKWTVGTRPPEVEVERRAVSVAALLKLKGEAFLRVAYVSLLGRPPDEGGRSVYLRLAEGDEAQRRRLVYALHGSDECSARGVVLVEDGAAQAAARAPAPAPAPAPVPPNGAASNQVGRYVVRGVVLAPSFSSLRGREFVEMAYRELLGREADADGIAAYIDEASGPWTARVSVLRTLTACEEGRARGLRGVAFASPAMAASRRASLSELQRLQGEAFLTRVFNVALGRTPHRLARAFYRPMTEGVELDRRRLLAILAGCGPYEQSPFILVD